MEWTWAIVAFAVAFALQRSTRHVFTAPVLQRRNYAQRDVPTAGGVVAVAAALLVLAAVALVDFDEARRVVPTVTVAAGFGAVGLFDDLVGTHAARGLRGHLRAARRGQLTSGALKLMLGVAIAVVAVAPYSRDWDFIVPAVIVLAGAANVGNLFDLAPARASKVAVLVLAVVLVVAGSAGMAAPMVMVAATLALAPAELREQLMLGDAGANPLGAAVGVAVVHAAGDTGWIWGAAGLVVAVNVAGELVSFSRVIARVAPLRMLDELGRRR